MGSCRRSRPPGPAEGRDACVAADYRTPTGAVGAGAGARIGRGLGAPVPGGLGVAVREVDRAHVVAVVALNAFGAVVDPDTDARVSHPTADGPGEPPEGDWRSHTTLAAVVTDAPLAWGGCAVLAKMASAALARCLRPAFTPFDGDVVFGLSTGEGKPVSSPTLLALGDAGAGALQDAILGLMDGVALP